MKQTYHYLSDESADDFFVAGQKVSAGYYRLVGSQRDIRLDHEDTLPASLDGRVAVYVRRPMTWGDLLKTKVDEVQAA